LKPAILLGASLLLTSVIPASAGGALVLQSAQIEHDVGNSYFFAGPAGGSSAFATSPFPNDAQNSAGAGPGGLAALVNLTGTGGGAFGPLAVTRHWNDYSFSVVFDIDQTYPFTFHRGIGSTDDSMATATLWREGERPVTLPTSGGLSGMLEPGHYTFSGCTYFRQPSGSIRSPYSFRGGFTDTTLTVLPEPGAAALLSLPTLCLRRRRR